MVLDSGSIAVTEVSGITFVLRKKFCDIIICTHPFPLAPSLSAEGGGEEVEPPTKGEGGLKGSQFFKGGGWLLGKRG